jgi:hypothetical protein
MKMKNEEQKVNKKRHLSELRKKRKTEPNLNRKRAKRNVLPIILIACEGKNTEPSYFNRFEIKSIQIEPKGDGYNHLSLVNWAQKLAQFKKYDEVWCVFDADPKPDNPNWAHNFNNAIWTANKMGYKVGYSHQAFEYWLILHFDDHQGGMMSRADYNEKLNSLLEPFGVNYDGNGSKKVSAELFQLLDGKDPTTNKKRVELAICRAKRNYDLHDHTNPSKEESTTTLFKLVLELLNFDKDKEKKLTLEELC